MLVVLALVALTASCSPSRVTMPMPAVERTDTGAPAPTSRAPTSSAPSSNAALATRPAVDISGCVLPNGPGPAPRAGLLLHLSVTDRPEWESADGIFTVTNTSETTATLEQRVQGPDFQQIQDASGTTVNGGQLPETPIRYVRVVVPPHKSVKIRADFRKYPCQTGTRNVKARGPFRAVGHLTVRTPGGTLRSWYAANTVPVTDTFVDTVRVRD